MTNEEMQTTMEFILNQQARLVTNQQKMDERMTRLEDIVGKLAAATLSRFEGLEAKLAEMSENFDRKIAALVDAQMRTEENVKKTDEAVRNLTAVVDRYFRERNGG
jgi:predicted  nucleic acid-binding Zn-ribbon protein